MSELGVSSEGKHYMDSMLLLKRRHLARRVTAGRSGAVFVVVQGRTRRGKERKIRIRSLSTKRHRSKYTLLKPKKKELKVEFLL